jgi:hypothetical protein
LKLDEEALHDVEVAAEEWVEQVHDFSDEV